MSRQTGRSAPDSAAAKRGRSTWFKLATVAFLLPVIAVLLPTAILLAIMLLPTIVAYIVDRVPGRAFATTVGLLNGAGCIPGLVELWSNGHDFAATKWVLSDGIVWIWAYACAAVAWLIFLALPPLLRRYYAFAMQSRIHGLQRRQEQLRKDWGQAVTGVGEAEQEAPETSEAAPTDAQIGATGSGGGRKPAAAV